MRIRPGTVVLALTLGLSLGGVSAAAHHNMSAMFDFNQRFTRTGTLVKTDWRNPHIFLSVETKNDQGQTETWSFEGPSPTVFRNLSADKDDFINAIGKTLTIEASRARDGSLKGLMRIVTLPGGKVLSLCPQNC